MGTNQDTLIHAIAADGQIRCMAAVTTNLVAEACRRHRTFPTASAALGRALTGTLLLGAGVKDLEKITVHFDCEGPIGNIVTQSDAHGNVRGYVSNPEADVTSMNAMGKFDVRAVVGGGTMYVTRDAGFDIGLVKEPYRGSVPIVSGEIAEDFAYYLLKSEQINSAVGLGVLMTVDTADHSVAEVAGGPEFALDRLRTAAAGGFIVQLMPGADETVINHLEKSLAITPNSSEMVHEGRSAEEMLRSILGDLDLKVLGESHPRFACQCSRERAILIISGLGSEEVADMLQKDGGAELTCHFCNELYRITGDELSAIVAVRE